MRDLWGKSPPHIIYSNNNTAAYLMFILCPTHVAIHIKLHFNYASNECDVIGDHTNASTLVHY